MINKNILFLFFSLAGTASLMGIGISIGIRSITGVIICITLFLLTMGVGFKLKRIVKEKD